MPPAPPAEPAGGSVPPAAARPWGAPPGPAGPQLAGPPTRALNNEQVVSCLDDVVRGGLNQHRLHLLRHSHRGLGGRETLLPGFLVSLRQRGGGGSP